MMAENFHIVVEGKEDMCFLVGYLGHLFPGEVLSSSVSFRILYGINKLGGQVQNIREKLIRPPRGTRILIFPDADKEGYADKKKEVERILRSNWSDNENMEEFERILGVRLHLFLFPNNKSSGILEDLLKKIILPRHRDVFTCFDGYVKCLTRSKGGYDPPDIKAKIYAYKHALKILNKLHDDTRKTYSYEKAHGMLKGKNPFDPQHWDFDNSALEPLKKFLTKHIPGQ
ncbi:MAG: hypothetical protein OXU40_05410 [Nitrospira sp.]|nr:hypothetical protein [Nitrospira sp.]